MLAAEPALKNSETAALSGNSEISGYFAKRENDEKITTDDILPLSEKKSDKGKFKQGVKKQAREQGQKIAKKKVKEILDTTDNVGSKAIQGGEKVAIKVIDVTVDGATEILDAGKDGAVKIVGKVKDGAVEAATLGLDTGLDILKTSIAVAEPAAVTGSLLSDVLVKGKELAKKDIDKWGSKNEESKSTTNTAENNIVEEKLEKEED